MLTGCTERKSLEEGHRGEPGEAEEEPPCQKGGGMAFGDVVSAVAPCGAG